MIQRVQTVFASDGEKTSGFQTPIDDFRHRLAHPVDVRFSRLVFKGENEDQMAMRLYLGIWSGGLLGRGIRGDPDGQKGHERSESEREFHAASIIVAATIVTTGAHRAGMAIQTQRFPGEQAA
jgi:hypothetical protein